MGSRYKLITIFSITLLVVFIFLVIISGFKLQKNDYTDKLTSSFTNTKEITVKNIFPFDFKCAYIFNDSYLSGEGFALRYNLDISIPQVNSGASENLQRIVFVDEQGSFVYEFKCDKTEICIIEEGIVIYPETIIEKQSFNDTKPLLLRFCSSEYYDKKQSVVGSMIDPETN